MRTPRSSARRTRPFANHPTIVVLRGSLAPEGSVVKLAVRRPGRAGSAARPVYHSRDAGLEGLRTGEIQPARSCSCPASACAGGPAWA